jgi:hypothetical protein
MTAGKKCLICRKGYLVAEYSKSEAQDNYYCNNCFKYKVIKSKDKYHSQHKPIHFNQNEDDWELFGDKEVAEFLDRVFKDFN